MSKNHSFLEKRKIEEILNFECPNVHFVGVGGVSMYSLFCLSESFGIKVSGSDRKNGKLVKKLIENKKDVYVGSEKEKISGVDLVVYSLAVSIDDEELCEANRLNIPSVSRAEYLGVLMDRFKTKIGVSGSHGKSTVTAMLEKIFVEAFREPTVLCGALTDKKSPVLIGKRDYLIYEACEYKDSFLRFFPTYSIFLNLEYDHTDYFRSFNDLKGSFVKAMTLAEHPIINIDDNNLCHLARKSEIPLVSYSVKNKADYMAEDIRSDKGLYSFKVRRKGGEAAPVSLKIAGSFNVYNALGAISCACEAGIDLALSAAAVSKFSGIERRLQYLGEYNGSCVYYDYAHHPSEIKCTVEAVREQNPLPVCAIFRPHTYSRTEAFLCEFAEALLLCDKVFLIEVEGIRETRIDGVSSENIANLIGGRAEFISPEDIRERLMGVPKSNIIIMGAADMSEVLSRLGFNPEI